MAKRKKEEPGNPFIYKGYEGPTYFCDRTEETEKIVSALENGSNITLISPRRIGKTGLIKHVFHRIKEVHKDAICTTQTFTTYKGVAGLLIVSTVEGHEGNNIFLPAAGRYYSNSLYVRDEGVAASYWTRSLNSNSTSYYGNCLLFSATTIRNNYDMRSLPLSVRPVRNQ